MTTDTPKSFQPNQKEIKYLGKDFSGFKDSLLDFAKTYYPNTYKDFSETSVGMLFMEQAAYIGDVLSFYIDYQFKESLPIAAEERRNIISWAKYIGYKPKTTGTSIGSLDVYQLVPSIQSEEGTFSPDMRFAQTIRENMSVASDTGINFITSEPVDFSVDTENSPTEISIFQRNDVGQPEFYALKKSVPISSGTIKIKEVMVGSPTAYYTVELMETDVVGVLDVYDSDGNRWYESDYLSQDLIPTQIENINKNDQEMSKFRDSVPFLLKFIRTSRRFVTSVTDQNKTVLEFGSGTNVQGDTVISLNSVTVKNPYGNVNASYDPSNFLSNSSYGQSPSNTTLTIRYVTGGGIESNVNANSIKNVVSANFFGNLSDLPEGDRRITQMIRSSIRVNNPDPTIGGRAGETSTEIKENARANFSSQNRVVTKQDYVVRSYAMPAKYGTIARAYATTDNSLSTTLQSKNNQYAINLYVLCRDSNGRFTKSNPALVHNLRNYLNEFRLLTDSVNIIDGYIINIGAEFSIVTYKNYNKREVLTNCINAVTTFLSSENMHFCQTINLSRLKLEIAKINGVQSVASLKLKNLTIKNGDYSEHEYNIDAATSNEIVYPSIDPSIFEVRFPSKDIVGKVL